jgi:hypothetical protein
MKIGVGHANAGAREGFVVGLTIQGTVCQLVMNAFRNQCRTARSSVTWS